MVLQMLTNVDHKKNCLVFLLLMRLSGRSKRWLSHALRPEL